MAVVEDFCTKLAAMATRGQTSVRYPRPGRLSVPAWLLALALVCSATALCAAQSAKPAPQTQPAVAAAAPVPAPLDLHPVVTLDGPWRFQIGDDPRWSVPSFDDSNWTAVFLSKPLSEQGIGSYSGFAWYRMRLRPGQLDALGLGSPTTTPEVLVTPSSVGQLALYVNNLQTGRTTGMGDTLTAYQSLPFIASLSSPAADGSRLLAVRTWVPENVPVHAGLLSSIQLGAPAEIASLRDLAVTRLWAERVTTLVVVGFLFLCVAILGAILFLAQRNHTEYLWLALLCINVTVSAAAEDLYGVAVMPLHTYQTFSYFSGHIFMVVTLEFIYRFTATPWRRTVRGIQLGFLLLPFVSFLHIQSVYSVLSVSAEVVFSVFACLMLFRAWRKGQRDAGVMLLPFFLASIGDSLDTIIGYFAAIHLLPASFDSHIFHIGPVAFGTGAVTYIIFLFSLVAVILYRFIRVSQDEQRSAAEVAAARSVQALLIPTQLPRSRNFVLESAYLPVNGVGGDFFQVLPLKDDSLLIVVGDVSGKGLQAAMNSSTLVGALRNELSHDPATILAHLNRVLIGAVSVPGAVPELDAAPGFATCLCARIYPDGSMTIANAGHLSPYRDGREMEIEPSLPLGVIAGAEYVQTNHTLSKGDRLVFISDGVVEATGPHGELFGFDRTRQVSVESARYIAQTAKHFGQTDDITVVSLYVASTRPLAEASQSSAAPAAGAFESA
jgi:Stage II sporulation protein E (SpoIIE)/7TM diverse intracellular signalling